MNWDRDSKVVWLGDAKKTDDRFSLALGHARTRKVPAVFLLP